MATLGQVRYKELANDYRLDSDYYIGPGSVLREKIKKTGKPFDEYFVKIVHPGEFTRQYVGQGHLFLRAQNVRSGRIDCPTPVFVNDAVYESLPDAIARERDILLVRTGANLADATLVPSRFKGALVSSHTLRLVPKTTASIHALGFYFCCDAGRAVLLSLRTGGTHGQINGSSLESLYFPNLSRAEKRCKQLWHEIEALEIDAASKYPEAEAELLERIGWKEFIKTPARLHYLERFSTISGAMRMDAEHFQPQTTRLRKLIHRLGALNIWDFCPLPRRGVQPEFAEDGTVLVIDSKAVRPGSLEPSSTEKTSEAFATDPRNSRARVCLGNVLLNSTGRGTLGRAACWLREEYALADNHVAILKPDLTKCLPVYLALFLNSPAGLIQSEMFQTGSSGQLELYPADVVKIVVFVPKNRDGEPDINWQQRLVDKVVVANNARTEAAKKLAEGKKIVEEEIKRRML